MQVVIREGAAEALNATLALVQVRENRQRKQWYQKILEETQKGFKAGSADAIHGSLLTLRELISQKGMVRYLVSERRRLGSVLCTFLQYPQEKYKGLCESVLKYKDHRDGLVRRTVILMIPVLAQFDPTDFVAAYLNGCMAYLLSQLKKDRDRSAGM